MSVTIALQQQAVLDQAGGAYEKPVAGERRKRLVRRVSKSGGTCGERLPPQLTRFAQAVSPLEGRRTQVANAVGRGQRRNVQEQAAGTITRLEERSSCRLGVSAHSK